MHYVDASVDVTDLLRMLELIINCGDGLDRPSRVSRLSKLRALGKRSEIRLRCACKNVLQNPSAGYGLRRLFVQFTILAAFGLIGQPFDFELLRRGDHDQPVKHAKIGLIASSFKVSVAIVD